MGENLLTSVRREINRLKTEIGQRTSELASLKDELRRHQRVYGLLGGPDRRARRARKSRGRTRRRAPANWNSVLQGLPSRFSVGDLAKATDAEGKSPVYFRQVAVRWVREGKTKRVARGKYQKVEPKKSRVAARPRRK